MKEKDISLRYLKDILKYVEEDLEEYKNYLRGIQKETYPRSWALANLNVSVTKRTKKLLKKILKKHPDGA